MICWRVSSARARAKATESGFVFRFLSIDTCLSVEMITRRRTVSRLGGRVLENADGWRRRDVYGGVGLK
jgi:hypothetical protein